MGSQGIIAYRPAIGLTITDPNTKTTYILQKVIGNSGYDFVYKACYYSPNYSRNGSLLPSGYVTVKHLNHSKETTRSKAQERLNDQNENILHVDVWYVRKFQKGFLSALPYMSEGSLRYMLSTRFHYGLPEDCIAIALKEALFGLFDIHDSGRVHKSFSAEDIFVNYKSRPVSTVEIKLAYAATTYESNLETPIFVNEAVNPRFERGEPSVPPLSIISEWGSAPEVYYTRYYDSDSDDDNRNPAYRRQEDESCYSGKSDIWLVGIAALELAYGNIRVSHRSEFESMIKKIRRAKKLPGKLEDLLGEINAEEVGGKMKKAVGYVKDKMKSVKKQRDRVFTKGFEELVMDCLSTKESKRPAVQELLQRPFFQNAKDLKWFQRRVLNAKNPMPNADND
ncbi:serine/threonine-protein kinase BLUS1-like [Capsicum chacoense]